MPYIDNNREKSVFAHYSYTRGARLTLGALYFGGIERPNGAPDGWAWRHLWDVWTVVKVAPRLSALVELDAGIEPNHTGSRGGSRWFAVMRGLRVRLAKWAYLAGRGTYLRRRGGRQPRVADPVDRFVDRDLRRTDRQPPVDEARSPPRPRRDVDLLQG